MNKALLLPLIFCFVAVSVFGDGAEDSYKNGVEKQKSGDLDGAWADFNNAIYLNPTDARSYNSRGVVRQAKGDSAGALADLDKAIELKPDYVEAYDNRGNLMVAKGNLAGAMADLGKAIEIKPNYPGYFARGRLQQIGGNLDGALADLSKAIELNPNFPGTYYFRGCLYYDQHSFTNAAADFRKVGELNSPSDYAHFRLWLVRARLGEQDAATKELQAYLSERKTGPPTGWLAQVSRFLTGELPETDFLKAAAEGDQKKSNALEREAYFLAGTVRLIDGDKATAANYFRQCVATGVKEDPSYQSAAAELKFLDGAK